MPGSPVTAGTKVQPHRRRYSRATCGGRFDDLTGTALAGHHQPLRVWVLCLCLVGLNLSNERGSVRLLWPEKRSGV